MKHDAFRSKVPLDSTRILDQPVNIEQGRAPCLEIGLGLDIVKLTPIANVYYYKSR